ncbi:MAG TPA: anhydro-N-acetylmuramic acid kinase, partial [Segetibacter sp.]
PHPKSLANEFGINTVFPLVNAFDISNADKLRTYAEHIVMQLVYSIQKLSANNDVRNTKLMVTGGGTFNTFLVRSLTQALQSLAIEVIAPDAMIIDYKEALIMGLIGV